MKTIENRFGRRHQGAVLGMLITAGAACVVEPGIARADEPAATKPAATKPADTTPKAEEPAAAPARPAPVISIRANRALASKREAAKARAEFLARVKSSGLCSGAEVKAYNEAAVPPLPSDPKQKRDKIVEIAKAQGITVTAPSDADLAKRDGLAKLAAAETALTSELEKKQKKAHDDFLTSAKASLSSSGPKCDGACAEAAFNVCTIQGKGDDKGVDKAFDKGLDAAMPASVAAGLASFQTSLVTGLAQFLQARAEAEITTWLLTQVKKDLCSGEGKDWFPETCALFDDANGYSVNSGTSVLAAAVRKDLERLPAHTLAYATGLDKSLTVVMVDTLWKMRDGQKPLEMLAGLGTNKTLVSLCNPKEPPKKVDPSQAMACVLVAVGKAAASCGDAAQSDNLESELPGLVEDFVKEMTPVLPSLGGGGALTEENVKDFLRAVRALHAQLADWETGPAPTGNAAIERGGIALRLSLSVLDAAITMVGDEKVQKTWTYLSHGLAGASEILQGHPAEAVQELMSLVRLAATVLETKKGLPKDVARHLVLIADLAGAKTANEVQGILESAAAPVGGYLEKRRGPMLSATGIVGLSIGAEVPIGVDYKRQLPDAAFSPMAMVGLDLSFPCGDSTVGAYFSLLDVGQLLALPFGAPAGETKDGAKAAAAVNDKVELAQVISPGVFFRVGIDKTPLTWGIGASYAPQLRSYVETDLTTKKEVGRDLFDMVRIQTFLAVDVTLMPLKRF